MSLSGLGHGGRKEKETEAEEELCGGKVGGILLAPLEELWDSGRLPLNLLISIRRESHSDIKCLSDRRSIKGLASKICHDVSRDI